jgi:hypothetical protein
MTSAPPRVVKSFPALAFAVFCLAAWLRPAPVALALDISGSVSGVQFGAGDLTSGDVVTHVDISGGTVNLQSGGNVDGRVIGGATDFGDVSVSSVHVTGGTASNSIHGGLVNSVGDVTGNWITIDSGDITQGLVGGITPSGKVVDNKVLINGGIVSSEMIAGGQANQSNQVTGNEVTISEGSVRGFFISGGVATVSSNLSGNKVTIS